MSDEESVYSEEEEEEPKTPVTPAPAEDKGGEDAGSILKHRQESKKAELDDQLKEYIAEWRKQRSKEEEELKKLKEKQAKRKVARAEEELRLTAAKKAEDERRMREEQEQKEKIQAEKRKRLEESERKRQQMMKANQERKGSQGPNFVVNKKDDKFSNIQAAKSEIGKTKEQLAEEKKIALSIRVKPLSIDNLGLQPLQRKCTELWDLLVKLETEKYDLEERQKRQDYDLKELKERQKQQLRHKAMKKGLDPEALTGKYPPKITTASKFERCVDRRNFVDKKDLFEGGLEKSVKESQECSWDEKNQDFTKRSKSKLPKWFGERPGKKKDDPETPEGEEDVKGEDDDDELIPPPELEEEPEEEPEEEEAEEEEEGDEEEEEEEEE